MRQGKGAWTTSRPDPAPGRLVYVDGEFVPAAQAVVSVFDHGYLFGDGVFEGLRSYRGRVFRLKEHVKRLFDSAKVISLRIPLDEAEVADTVRESVRVNRLWDSYIRLVVSRGIGDLGLDPRKCPSPSVVCIADAIQVWPPEVYERGLRIVTAATRRNLPEALNPRLKSLNYLNNVLAKIEANRAGVPEALMLSHEGWVAEGTGANFFIVKDGKVQTPAVHHGLLHGITRACVIELAARRGLATVETTLARYDVFTAEEAFMTGTAVEICPVVELDGRPVGDGKPGPVTRQLMADFRELVNSEGAPCYSEAELGALAVRDGP